jgi:hypothetical protein
MLAMRHGTSGNRYMLGGERLTIPDYFALISRKCRRPPPYFVAPRWAMLGASIGCSLAGYLGV